MLTPILLKELGFTPVPHFTVMDNYNYSLGRNTYLSIGCTGTPNEMLYLGQLDPDTNIYSDLICLHNYDYDGLLTQDKLQKYITTLSH